MTKRQEGKKMLGGWVSGKLMDAIKEWRQKNPGKLKTDFILEASLEKLEAEGIEVDRAAILQDGRSKLELPAAVAVTYTPRPRSKAASSGPPSAVKQTAVASASLAAKLVQESEPKPKAVAPSADRSAPVAGVGKAKK